MEAPNQTITKALPTKIVGGAIALASALFCLLVICFCFAGTYFFSFVFETLPVILGISLSAGAFRLLLPRSESIPSVACGAFGALIGFAMVLLYVESHIAEAKQPSGETPAMRESSDGLVGWG